MTREEAAQKQAAAIVERRRLVLRKFQGPPLTPDEAKRLAELDAYLDDLHTIIYPEFHASLDAQLKRLKGDT